MELIVTSAIGCQIGQDPHGLRLVKVQETEVEHATPTYFRFLNFDQLRTVGILTNLAYQWHKLHVLDQPEIKTSILLIFPVVGEWLKIVG